MANYTYDVALNNRDTIFDAESDFEDIESVVEWVEKHGGDFNVQIVKQHGDTMIFSEHLSVNGNKWYLYYYDRWYAIPRELIADYFAAPDAWGFIRANKLREAR